MGNEQYTEQQINLAEKWENIASYALDKQKQAKDDFKSNAWFVGGATAVLIAFNTAVSGGTIGAVACATLPLIFLSKAHFSSFYIQDFYKQFSDYAVKKYNSVYDDDSDINSKPPIPLTAEKDFSNAEYIKPSLLEPLYHFRSAVIASVVALGLAVYSQGNIQVEMPLFRDERSEDVPNEASELAPKVSPRPVPRPAL
jgi:hypothetical protein